MNGVMEPDDRERLGRADYTFASSQGTLHIYRREGGDLK